MLGSAITCILNLRPLTAAKTLVAQAFQPVSPTLVYGAGEDLTVLYRFTMLPSGSRK
jgi:hypothetical protein